MLIDPGGEMASPLHGWLLSLLGGLLLVAGNASADVVIYYHTDGLGTPVMESNAAGQVTYTREHRPYGEQALGAAKHGPGFTGHVGDADTGLIYMQARYYDPVAGRFLSNDPIVTDLKAGSNFNRYWYANNNPYRFIDPDGRKAAETDDKENNESDEAVTPGLVLKTEAQLTKWLAIAIDQNGIKLIGTKDLAGAKLTVDSEGKGSLEIPGLGKWGFDAGNKPLTQLDSFTKGAKLGFDLGKVSASLGIDKSGMLNASVTLSSGKLFDVFSSGVTFSAKVHPYETIRQSEIGQKVRSFERRTRQCIADNEAGNASAACGAQ